ncbi:MAG: phospho-N-acetylmuramoyl-pentapeptide-transferase, partial [Elusimicrobiaceae bacterium]|nr:phospho-N-acetylmuramoyl-pentapeptide-transferase [Elusimicrobiaceae bacterium]
MLYYLSLFKDDLSFLNIFSYITFRTGAAIFTSFLLTLCIGPAVVRKLRSYKIQQIEREYGPASHLSKNGTPTMGGILIFVSLVVSVLLWAKLDTNYIWLLLFTTFTLGIAGVMDDYTKLIKKNPEGMKSSIKLAIQLLTALVVVVYLAMNPPNAQYSTSIIIP